MELNKKIKLAVYVYPAWHPSEYRKTLGFSWTEWELLKSAKPVFLGHKISEKPLWGYYDDSNRNFVEKQIATALKYNIDAFIFSYYWDKKPILNEGIDKGFLTAKNNGKINFALMFSPRLPRINLPLPLKTEDGIDREKRMADLF